MMRRGLLALLILASLSRVAHGATMLNVGHVELLGAYSEVKDGNTDVGQDLTGFWAPIIKISDTYCVIPLIDVHLNRVAQFLPEDQGNRFNNTYLTTNTNIAFRKEFKPGWFSKVTVLGTWNFMKESQEDNWGKGLYDYTDVGANLEVKHLKKTDTSEGNAALSFEYYRRKYPNFQTLISETSVTPPEVDEKDFHAFKPKLRLDYATAGGLTLFAQPYFESRHFDDKHLVKDDGTLDLAKKRTDSQVVLDFGASHRLPWEKLTLGLDNSLTHYRSNIGFYDTRSTLSLSDDVFTADYYNYDSGRISPWFEFAYPITNEKIIRARLGYAFNYRRYLDRKAQSANGTYLPEDQKDNEQEMFFSLNIPLANDWDWVTRYSNTRTRSNQEYEAFYRYSYDYATIKSGVAVDF